MSKFAKFFSYPRWINPPFLKVPMVCMKAICGKSVDFFQNSAIVRHNKKGSGGVYIIRCTWSLIEIVLRLFFNNPAIHRHGCLWKWDMGQDVPYRTVAVDIITYMKSLRNIQLKLLALNIVRAIGTRLYYVVRSST